MKGSKMADPLVRYMRPDNDCPDEVPLVIGYNNDPSSIGYSMYQSEKHLQNRPGK